MHASTATLNRKHRKPMSFVVYMKTCIVLLLYSKAKVIQQKHKQKFLTQIVYGLTLVLCQIFWKIGQPQNVWRMPHELTDAYTLNVVLSLKKKNKNQNLQLTSVI